MRITRTLTILFVGLLLIIIGGCASTRQTPTPPAPAPMTLPMASLIKIISDPQLAQGIGPYGGEFRPRTITVSVGAVVTWNNTDTKGHTVTSNDGLFNKRLAYGESFSYTFTERGSFTYHCDLYDMTGMVNVEIRN